MSMNQIRFTCTVLKGTGKVGRLTPDKDGYFTVPLGALNVYNSAMEFYPYEESKKLFEKSGLLMRRVQKGVLRGELGHPKRQGMSDKEFIYRCAQIYEQNWCFHLSEVWLDEEISKDITGQSMILVMGKARQCGPYGSTFLESMQNQMENTCFSVRSFTDDYVRNGRVEKIIVEIVTWDLVNEPGVATATKYSAPTLESMGFTIQKSEMDRAFHTELKTPGLGMESSSFDIGALYRTMGWDGTAKRRAFSTGW